MTPSDKADAVTGIVTVTLGVLSGSFSPADFHEWGTTIMGLSPFVLILFLIWRMRQLDSQHKECTANQIKTQDQLVLTFRALQDSQIRRNLPNEEEFTAGSFCLDNHTSKER